MDLDGVITDTFSIHVDGWTKIVQSLGGKPDLDYLLTLRGIPTEDAMRMVLETHNLTSELENIKQHVATKINLRNESIKRMGAEDVTLLAEVLLTECEEFGVPTLCLATTSAAYAILDVCQVRDKVGRIIAGPDVAPPKRIAADVLLKHLETSGIRRDQALYIDDSIEAVSLSRTAGVPSIALSGFCTLKRVECETGRKDTLQDPLISRLFQDAREL